MSLLQQRSRSALVIIDVQARLAPAIHEAEQVVARIAMLARAARRLAIPVLATEHYPKGLGATVPELAALLPPDAVVEKIHFGCAAEPACAARIAALDRPQLVLVGMETHVCLMQSALGLAASGYQVAVVADAVGSRRSSDRDLALARLRQAGLTLVSAEMVVFEWLGRGDDPAFRDVLALLK